MMTLTYITDNMAEMARRFSISFMFYRAQYLSPVRPDDNHTGDSATLLSITNCNLQWPNNYVRDKIRKFSSVISLLFYADSYCPAKPMTATAYFSSTQLPPVGLSSSRPMRAGQSQSPSALTVGVVLTVLVDTVSPLLVSTAGVPVLSVPAPVVTGCGFTVPVSSAGLTVVTPAGSVFSCPVPVSFAVAISWVVTPAGPGVVGLVGVVGPAVMFDKHIVSTWNKVTLK